MDTLHDCCDNPTCVGQDEGQEQVGVDLVPQTSHFPDTGSIK